MYHGLTTYSHYRYNQIDPVSRHVAFKVGTYAPYASADAPATPTNLFFFASEDHMLRACANYFVVDKIIRDFIGEYISPIREKFEELLIYIVPDTPSIFIRELAHICASNNIRISFMEYNHDSKGYYCA